LEACELVGLGADVLGREQRRKQMRFDGSNKVIVLSRRNLLALLAKLEQQRAGEKTYCTIHKNIDGEEIWVRAEEDEKHYAQTALKDPGTMKGSTEILMDKLSKLLSQAAPVKDLNLNSWKD
jgi:hypothetical protein